MENIKSKRKIAGNLFFVLITLIGLLVVIFSLNDIKDIFEALKTTNLLYIMIALVISVLHMFITSVTMHSMSSGLGVKLKFRDSLAIGGSEYFFNAITPFASGGQPVQGYLLVKKEVPGDKAISILMANFIVYQTIMTVFSTIGLIMFYGQVKEILNEYLFLILIGYFINLSILVFLILISVLPKMYRIFEGLFNLLSKIKIISKKMIGLENKTFKFVENFQQGMGLLFKRKRVFLGATFLRITAILLLNSVPFFVFLAFGLELDITDLAFVIVMSAFSTTFMMWVPTPGASGGTEWAFTVIFVSLLAGKPQSILVASMLVWRLLTYYLGMIYGFISYYLISKRGN
ncbi:MAG TPA: lysylphosphatidylglycerol synthase transmembrane domain-containing protein [Acholeplasma sp.]|nr:lysylphosphatidylglycerol synthase transmembrane domain-containing protein [Acholeplasma sp.]